MTFMYVMYAIFFPKTNILKGPKNQSNLCKELTFSKLAYKDPSRPHMLSCSCLPYEENNAYEEV